MHLISFTNTNETLPILNGQIKTESTDWKNARMLVDSGAERSQIIDS
jgi:hypothetical protein